MNVRIIVVALFSFVFGATLFAASESGMKKPPFMHPAQEEPLMKKLAYATALVLTVLPDNLIACSIPQSPTVRSIDETTLREYTGVYQWRSNAFVYLQMWNEFSGFTKPSQLVAFDESGEVRTLYPLDRDQFFAGPGAAIPTS